MFHFFSPQKAILNSISLNYLYAVCEHAICEHVGLLKSFPSIVHEIYLLWNKTKQKTARRNKQKQMGNLPASDSTTGTLSPGTLVRHSVICNAFADIPSHFTGRIKSPVPCVSTALYYLLCHLYADCLHLHVSPRSILRTGTLSLH